MNRKKERRTRTNLVDELGDFLLEPLHHIGQSLNFVSLVDIEDAFGADCLLVFLAERVDFLLWMLFTTGNPRADPLPGFIPSSREMNWWCADTLAFRCGFLQVSQND